MPSRSRDVVRVCAVVAALVVLVLALTGCTPGPRAGSEGSSAGTSAPRAPGSNTAGSAQPGAAGPDGANPCRPDTLRTSVVDGTPAAGTRSVIITLVNRGTEACALGAHTAEVSMLDGSGSPIPTVQTEGRPAPGREPVDVVAAGGAVSMTVSWRVVPSAAAPPADCREGGGLRIALPVGAVDVGEPLTACGNGTLFTTPYGATDDSA